METVSAYESANEMPIRDVDELAEMSTVVTATLREVRPGVFTYEESDDDDPWAGSVVHDGYVFEPLQSIKGASEVELLTGVRDNQAMSGEHVTIQLSMTDLREVTAYATACAEPALAIFERDCPDDPRPRDALGEARKFAGGGNRTKALRVTALAAHRAARAARGMGREAASDAAHSTGHAAASAYLHPLAKGHQVKHILGSAVHAARALELDGDDEHSIGTDYVEKVAALANPVVVGVLARYPKPPNGGGRVGELLRRLDAALRLRSTDI